MNYDMYYAVFAYSQYTEFSPVFGAEECRPGLYCQVELPPTLPCKSCDRKSYVTSKGYCPPCIKIACSIYLWFLPPEVMEGWKWYHPLPLIDWKSFDFYKDY